MSLNPFVRTHRVTDLVWVLLLAGLSACGGAGLNPDGDTEADADEASCQCPVGTYCDYLGECVSDCLSDADCPAGKFCHTQFGQCQDRPDPDGDKESLPPDGDGGENPESADGDAPDGEESIPYAPFISVDPLSLDFGAVVQGAEASRTFTILNQGEADLIVSSIAMETASTEFSFPGTSGSFTLEPDQSRLVTVVFTPNDSEPDSNAILISSNDPLRPVKSISVVTDIKLEPDIRIDPETIDLGTVKSSEGGQRTVYLTNDGGAILDLLGLAFSEDSDDVFYLDEAPEVSSDHPLSMISLQMIDFLVRVKPSPAGDYEGTLKVRSSDPDEPVLSVPVMVKVCDPEVAADATALDFSGISLGGSETRTLTLSNEGCNDLYVSEIALSSTTTSDFTLESAPTVPMLLPMGESRQIVVRYTPDGAGPDVGALVIVNDDADEGRLIVEFLAEPVPPDISVNPETLSFGALTAGESLIKTIQVSNLSTGGLLILRRVEIESVGTIFYKANTPPDTIGPGQTALLKVGYRPDDPDDDSGVIRLHSNDPDEPILEIPLTGEGVSTNLCPTAVASEGGEYEPLATATLDASGSSDPDGTIILYQWRLLTKPDGSRTFPNPPNTVQSNLFFDVAGDYTVELKIQDNEGAHNCNPNPVVTFNVIPSEKIHILLFWDTDNSDFDIHLVRPGGTLWEGLNHGQTYPVTYGDCFFSTCKAASEPTGNPLNWGTYGRPSLDIDDQNGYGPENINLNDPGEGTYYLFVHYWDARNAGASTATVHIYVKGEKRFEGSLLFPKEHDLWDAASIEWSCDGEACDAAVAPRSTTLVEDEHGT